MNKVITMLVMQNKAIVIVMKERRKGRMMKKMSKKTAKETGLMVKKCGKKDDNDNDEQRGKGEGNMEE